MAPWKIVLQPQKVSRAARVSGIRNQRKDPSNCFHNFITISQISHFYESIKIYMV